MWVSEWVIDHKDKLTIPPLNPSYSRNPGHSNSMINVNNLMISFSEFWWKYISIHKYTMKYLKIWFSSMKIKIIVEMFYLNSTLNFGIPPVFVFQLEVCYKVDRLLTGITAQQEGTIARW